MAPSVPNTAQPPQGESHDAALNDFRQKWAKEAANHAIPGLPLDVDWTKMSSAFQDGPYTDVPLECGHWIDVKTCMSQKLCPQCQAPLPSRLDRYIHDTAKALWKVALYSTQSRDKVLQACFCYLNALPSFSHVSRFYPLNLHDEDLYWSISSLFVRVCLELNKLQEAELTCRDRLNECGGRARE